MNSKKWLTISGSLLAGAMALTAQADDVLPSVFDATTGYVTLERSDSAHGSRTVYAFCTNDVDNSIPPANCGHTGKWSESALCPHSGTNYYVGANKVLCADNSQGKAYLFAGDRLVFGKSSKFQQMAAGSNYATVNDLWMLGASTIYWAGVKNPLSGTLHVSGSSASSFVYLDSHLNYGEKYEAQVNDFNMDVIGDKNQYLFITGDTTSKGRSCVDGEVRGGQLRMNGDLSKYLGTIGIKERSLLQIKSSMPGTVQNFNCGTNTYFGVLADAGAIAVGKIVAGNGMKLVVFENSVLTITNLTLGALSSLCVRFGASGDTRGKIVILGGSLPEKIRIRIEDPLPSRFNNCEIVRIAKAAVSGRTLTTNNFELASAGTLPIDTELNVSEDGNEYAITISSPVWVTHIKGAKSSAKASENDIFACQDNSTPKKYYWSNESCPAQDQDAAQKIWHFLGTKGNEINTLYWYAPTMEGTAPARAIYNFPARAVVCESDYLQHSTAYSGFRARYIWRGHVENGVGGSSSIKFYPPDSPKSSYYTFGYYGTVQLDAGHTNVLQIYNGAELYEAEFSGGGDVMLKAYPNASKAETNQGWHEILGTNDTWTGKIKVTQDYEKNKYAASGVVTPNMDYNCRLVIRDARNLGGARATFAYDALDIEHYARLLIREDVTLAADLNRGVSVGDIGRFWQGEGKTLTINQPITLHGQLYKEGAGTLVLGGSAMKFGGSAQNDTPTVGSNLVTIAQGALKVTNAAAADGAAIRFAAGTALLVDDNATAETSLRSVKDGSRISYDDTQLAVNIAVADGASVAEREIVLCTSKQSDLNFEVTNRIRLHRVTLEKCGPVDGVYTYKAILTPSGTIIRLR